MRPATLVLLLASLAGCPGPAEPTTDAGAPPTPGSPEHSTRITPQARAVVIYADVEAEARREAEHAKHRAGQSSPSVSLLGRAAAGYVALARLTGSYDDYATAQDLLDAAFALKKPVSPYMVRARLHATLHRLAEAEADFLRHVALPNRTDEDRVAEALFAADLAFARGAYDEAQRRYDGVLRMGRTADALASAARYHWRVAEFDRAEALYRESIAALDPDAIQTLAWTHLQLGRMDLERGRHALAVAHYRDGASAMQGYWLVDEHIAEAQARQGKLEEAKELYVEVIGRTSDPAAMDAMAEILQGEGDDRGALAYVDRARAVYEQRLEHFPEATFGPAAQHFLAFGEPAVALDLAARNHDMHPNADAKHLLARTQLRAGAAREAKATIEAVLETKIRSAEIHATAARVFAAAKEKTKAEEHRAAAKALDPRVRL